MRKGYCLKRGICRYDSAYEFREGKITTVNPHVEALPGDFVIIKNDEEEATFEHSDGKRPRLTTYGL